MSDPQGNGATPGSGAILAFLNEVAGGRKLLGLVRERAEAGAESVAIVAPQNQPVAGQIVDRDELREAAQSRVEVTEAVFAEFGIEAVGAVMDPDPSLALDDAVRAFRPAEILLSCLYETRFGLIAPRPGRVGEGPLRGARDPRAGADRRRRGALGRHPHPGGGDQDGGERGADRQAEVQGRRLASSLHGDLPTLRATWRASRSVSDWRACWPSSTAPRSTPPASR